TLAMENIVGELTLVGELRGGQHALPVFPIFQPLALVAESIANDEGADAVTETVPPLAVVFDARAFLLEVASAVHHVIIPLSFIAVSVVPSHDAMTLATTILPVAGIGSVGSGQLALTVGVVQSPVPFVGLATHIACRSISLHHTLL